MDFNYEFLYVKETLIFPLPVTKAVDAHGVPAAWQYHHVKTVHAYAAFIFLVNIFIAKPPPVFSPLSA